MRRFALLALLLASCTLTAPGGGTEGVATEAIEVTPLDGAPAATGEANDTAAEAPPEQPAASEADVVTEAETPTEADAATEPQPEAAVAEPEPAPVLSPAAQACVKRGGRWVGTGSGLMACVRPTRDAGKSCTKQGDCQGYCLARSRTCAPYTPLFGCNDILQASGARATLCLD